MAIQKTQTITITLSEALRGRAYLNDNPLIAKVWEVPEYAGAELYDPGGFGYLIRVPVPDMWQPQRGITRPPHKPWRMVILPREVREWLFNYLERDIVAPLQFKLPLTPDIKEEVMLNLAKRKLDKLPEAKFGAPVPKILQKRRRKKKKVVDNATDSAIVVPASKSCDQTQQ